MIGRLVEIQVGLTSVKEQRNGVTGDILYLYLTAYHPRLNDELRISSSPSFLAGLKFSFVPKRIAKAQRKILLEKITTFGGSVDDQVGQSTLSKRHNF
jgi:hypothetical protein